MKTKSTLAKTVVGATRLVPVLLLLALPAVGQTEDYTCTTNNGSLTITCYDGPGGMVNIPDSINGLPVTGIGNRAFCGVGFRASIRWPLREPLTSGVFSNNVTSVPRTLPRPLTSITIPNSVTSIGNEAFESSTYLTRAY